MAMKKTVALSDIAKQRTVQLTKNNDITAKKYNNHRFTKNNNKECGHFEQSKFRVWPGSIITNKQRQNHESDDGYKKSDSNKIKQSQVQNKSRLGFDDVGLSTLMDLTVSGIGENTDNKNKSDKYMKLEKQKSMHSSNAQSCMNVISQMRSKLNRLSQKALPSTQIYTIYRPHALKCPKNQQNQFSVNKTHSKLYPSALSQPDYQHIFYLKQEILYTNLKQAIQKIRLIVLRRILRQIQINHNMKNIARTKCAKLVKNVFDQWLNYVKQEGEKKMVMEMIKNRIVQKRRNRENRERNGSREIQIQRVGQYEIVGCFMQKQQSKQ